MRSFKATIKSANGIENILVAAPNFDAARREAGRKGRVLKVKQMPKLIFGGGMSITDRTVFFQQQAHKRRKD